MKLHLAACKGADPLLFDATYGELMEDALSYCDRCPILDDCLTHVRPRQSYFDGVCSGKVWRHGRIIEPGLFAPEGETND